MKERNEDTEKLKGLIENFENAMKKGVISSLILLILEKEPCHGYKIGKAIQERTLGVWDPPSSTLYTVLSGMKEQELIECIEQEDEGRAKKVYEITHKGEEALKLMLEKVMTIKNSMMSFIASTMNTEEDLLPDKFHGGFPFDMFFRDAGERTPEESLRIAEFHKEMMKRKINDFKEQLENLEKKIAELKNIIKNK